MQEFSEADVRQFTQAMILVFKMQKTYGKTPEELKDLVKGFSWALGGYTMKEIISALKTYVLSHNDIPTPSDIIAIIDPQNAPLSADVYRNIKRKIKDDSSYVTQSERDYCRKFEENELAKVRK